MLDIFKAGRLRKQRAIGCAFGLVVDGYLVWARKEEVNCRNVPLVDLYLNEAQYLLDIALKCIALC